VWKKVFPVIILFLIFSPLCHPGYSEAAPLKIKVKPNQILMGASFNGTKISVSGEVPEDTEVLVRMVGQIENPRLKKKGRALGLLWMNLGTVEFHNVPVAFLLIPSNSLSKFSQNLGLGFAAFKDKIDITPVSENKDELFQKLYQMKQKAGLYGIQENAIHYGNTNSSVKSFTAALALPSNLPQGLYKVQVFAIKNDVVVSSVTKEIKAKEVGVPATLASLAFNHGTLYGVLAVIVAILVGMLTGIIFKGGKEAH
jgi:hypothetical protein